MAVSNDDMPHPVPPAAYLRYKENWFFLIFDKENDLFGAIHIVSEPIFDRILIACHLSIKGELFKYGSQIAFPENFGFSPELSDGQFSVNFVKAHEQIDLSLHNDDIDLDLSFSNRSPLFNFDDYDSANPEKPTLKEIMGVGTNQQHVHQQQGMYVKGELSVNSGEGSVNSGETSVNSSEAFEQKFVIDALGYRDHSRSIRSDNLVLKHLWSGLHFDKHVFGVMSVTSSLRESLPVLCGYVFDEEQGLRALREIEVITIGEKQGEGPDDQPSEVKLCLTDIYDEPFTISAFLNDRFASVPLQSEKPGPTPFVYKIVENFTPLTFHETGETGIGLIELGCRALKD